jgi:hypothetical protein
MWIKSCKQAMIVLSTSSLVRLRPVLSRSPEDTDLSRFAYRESRESIDFD